MFEQVSEGIPRFCQLTDLPDPDKAVWVWLGYVGANVRPCPRVRESPSYTMFPIARPDNCALAAAALVVMSDELRTRLYMRVQKNWLGQLFTEKFGWPPTI